MNLKNSLWIICVFISFALSAQDKTALKYISEVDSVNLKSVLYTLASEKYEGRKTGEKGFQLAEKYITELFEKYNVQKGNGKSYLQNIQAKRRELSNKRFILNNFNFKDNYSYSNTVFQDSVININEFVFAGYGAYDAVYNDFENIDVAGKGVLILTDGSPTNRYGIRYDSNQKTFPDKDYLKSQDAKAILHVRTGFDKIRDYSYNDISFWSRTQKSSTETPEIFINELLANKILEKENKTIKQLRYEIEKEGTPKSFSIATDATFNGNVFFSDANVNNIVAYIEGSSLKDEYVILTAHYDHIGKRWEEVYNGADDNASGVSSAIEIARVLTKAKKEKKGPKRSVIVLITAAEENGLLGAQYYVGNPVFPLDKTIACVNIDMVGRVDAAHQSGDSTYMYVSNHDTQSKPIREKIETIKPYAGKFKFEYHTYPAVNGNFRNSDHFVFHEKGIPSVMFTSGEHPDYHKPTDTEDKIAYKALYDRTKMVFLTLWELAND
ncbi:hypothetical protein D0T49_07190 [Paludibacter sp. 221]|uniref:M28 family peptidase n=1 Tax=Paludibacter sp. 221 TaxID=2302939 RepID=UPI0013D43AF2|nr:M28 family peptidase [Paludibacter sp. 221]NDV46830.1 hypothetical protein [Paludibacter sp. 221]